MKNYDFITDIAFKSKFGTLAEAFVIEALFEYSNKIVKQGPPENDNTLISGILWYNVALEVQSKLEEKFN
jgi:hypothetical protein